MEGGGGGLGGRDGAGQNTFEQRIVDELEHRVNKPAHGERRRLSVTMVGGL